MIRNYLIIFGLVLLFITSCKENDKAIDANGTVSENMQELPTKITASYLLDTIDIRKQVEIAKGIFYLFPDSAKRILLDLKLSPFFLNNPKELISLYYLLGRLHLSRDEYDSSFFYFYSGLQLAKNYPSESDWIPKYYVILAVNNDRLLRHDSTTFYLYHAVKIVENNTIKNKSAIIDVYLRLSQIWCDNGNLIKALAYLGKAEQTLKQVKDSVLALDLMLQKGAIQFQMGNSESALLLAKKVINEKPRSLQTQWFAQYLAGSILIMQNKNKEAIPHLSLALKICQQKGDQVEINRVNGALASAYSNSGNYRQAIMLFNQLLISSKKSNYGGGVGISSIIYHNLGITHSKIRQHAKANYYLHHALILQDSFSKLERTKVLSRMETQYQVAKKDKLLASQQLKLARQQSWIITISAATLLILVSSLALLKRKKHKEQMAELKASLNGAELERARLASTLHDGVLSQLSAVKLNFATMQDTGVEMPKGFEEALQQLALSISELRATSHHLYPEILEREGLVEALRLFCNKISNLTTVTINFEAVEDVPLLLPKEFALHLYRLVQELVQNILKHSEASAAFLQIISKDDCLSVAVEDNGKGLPLGWRKLGMGLSQLEKQVKAMRGTVEIDAKEGTNIYMEFDLQKIKNGTTLD